MPKKSSTSKRTVVTHTHPDASRKNIPTAEYQAMLDKGEQAPVRVAYERRNRDLDPQLVWRGKDEQDWSDLIVHAAPLYIQEKVHPKVLIDDLLRRSQADAKTAAAQLDLFADFNGLTSEAAKTEFYQHDAHWANRMILGDSLQVMASLAEREGLRGKVQCIYLDPPYGIKFNSNFQWSTTSRDVKDGNAAHITREPEQVKAFRDTWRDGIHSYLTYLRDRLTVARDLLTESGSIFVQIGDENVHRVRALMDEVFGADQHITTISLLKTTSNTTSYIASVYDSIIWFARDFAKLKYRQLYKSKDFGGEGAAEYTQVALPDSQRRALTIAEKRGETALPSGARVFRLDNLTSQSGGESTSFLYTWEGKTLGPGSGGWKTNLAGMNRLARAGRLRTRQIGNTITYVRYIDDFAAIPVANMWSDMTSGFNVYQPKIYVVQTNERIVERCLLMATDPGDLVLDPTCGSGTTAEIAEQWGRRWITIDTSRVALALARARLMGARYPFYLLKDSREGQLKEAEITRTMPSSQPVYGNLRQGFVYERVPHITLKSIANNTEIDVIWEKWQGTLESLREKLNAALKKDWQEWEIPREAEPKWSDEARHLHTEWWRARIERQKEIDASIAAKAEFEDLYDKPYPDNKKVRVAGPFTVESLSPHRTLGVDENGELIDSAAGRNQSEVYDFVALILENLKTAGVQQAHKEDKITFTALTPWPGDLVCAEGRYREGASPSPTGRGQGDVSPEAKRSGEGSKEKRAAIFIGPEFGTVSRPDLVTAAREAADAGFDVLIACAFNYDAHSTEFAKLGRLPVLKARMNADLHMAEDLKNTGKGNLFVIFGEPDIEVLPAPRPAPEGQLYVKLNGVDVFHPNLGEVRSDNADGIACWFIDTDYNEESFFVRHAYFLGANDPYSALKTSLKAEVNAEAWATLNSDTSRPFDKPKSGRIAVKVINHLGDEVMKVFKVL
jgi:adenine-specific DNA-methyltransferase